MSATVIQELAEHPGPTDILSVIEVADSSLGRHCGYKQRLYADAAIPIYVIVNLIDRVIEVYLEPVVGSGFYTNVTLLSVGQKLDLPTVSSTPVTLLVTDLLN